MYRCTSNSPPAPLSLFYFQSIFLLWSHKQWVKPHCVHFPTPHVHRRVNSLKTPLPFKDGSDWVQRKKVPCEGKERICKRKVKKIKEVMWGFFSISLWKEIKNQRRSGIEGLIKQNYFRKGEVFLALTEDGNYQNQK